MFCKFSNLFNWCISKLNFVYKRKLFGRFGEKRRIISKLFQKMLQVEVPYCRDRPLMDSSIMRPKIMQVAWEKMYNPTN